MIYFFQISFSPPVAWPGLALTQLSYWIYLHGLGIKELIILMPHNFGTHLIWLIIMSFTFSVATVTVFRIRFNLGALSPKIVVIYIKRISILLSYANPFLWINVTPNLFLSRKITYKNHNDSYMERLSIIVKYNPSTDSWKEMGNLLTARYEHSAIRSLARGHYLIIIFTWFSCRLHKQTASLLSVVSRTMDMGISKKLARWETIELLASITIHRT